ncbi:MAG TPA: hypothetical protein VH950_08985 [Gaiellaceae bacterium]|jgi:hypothetical protein
MGRLLAVFAIALALPASALAGGFATVQLSTLPAGTPPGGTWSPELTVLQHGVTPLDGLAPTVRLYDSAGAATEFDAIPTGQPGVYTADVVFPAEGTWRYEVFDGFSQTHTYAPVTITGGTASDSFPVVPVAAGAVAAVLLAAMAFLLVRRRRGGMPPVAEGTS